MLVPFSFSPECVYPFSEEKAVMNSALKGIDTVWSSVGVLIEDEQRSFYKKLFKSMDIPKWYRDKLLTLYHHHLKHGKITQLSDWHLPLDGTITELPPVKTLLIHPREKDAWFNNPDEGHIRNERTEVCRMDCLLASYLIEVEKTKFYSAQTEYDEHIKPLFAPFFELSKEIHIIDPHCGKELVVKQKSNAVAGIARFINWIIEEREKKGIPLDLLRIYTAKDIEWSMSNITKVSGEEIQTVWQAYFNNLDVPFQKIELCLAPGKAFKILHDRFLRFDAFAMQIGGGLAVFEGTKVISKALSVSTMRTPQIKDQEKKLLENSEKFVIYHKNE